MKKCVSISYLVGLVNQNKEGQLYEKIFYHPYFLSYGKKKI